MSVSVISPVFKPASSRPPLLVVMYSNPAFHPSTMNGVRIMADRFRVRVAYRNDDGPPAHWPREVEVQPIGPAGLQGDKAVRGPAAKVAEYSGFVRELRRTLAQACPRIIYAYDPIGFAAVMRARGSAASPPVVFHCHDLPPLERPQATSLQFWLVRYALHRTPDASLIVFPAKYRAQVWLERARDHRAALIVPNGAARDFLTLDDDLPTLAASRFAARRALYLGAMSADNGQREAIEALATVRKLSLQLVGFGSERYREQLRATAHVDGVETRTTIDGWVSDAERMRLLRQATLGLLLYKAVHFNWEHSGSSANKIFEYAAAGLPVVVPDRLSFREFFANDQWVAYANPDDPASIAHAIEAHLGDRERYVAMSLAARQAHEEKYNYETLFQPVMERVLAMTEGSRAVE